MIGRPRVLCLRLRRLQRRRTAAGGRDRQGGDHRERASLAPRAAL